MDRSTKIDVSYVPCETDANSCISGYGPAAVFCERVNEHSGSINGGEFLD